VAEGSGLEPESVTVPELYEASATGLLTLLRQCDAASLLVVAHNPGLAQLIELLTGRDPHGWLWHINEKFPTSAICGLRHPTWDELGEGSAELLTYAIPRAS